MLVACVGVYGERVDQAIVCIKRLRPYVDRYVVIVDESVTEEQKQKLRDLGCEVYFHPWEDSTVKMRNQYLQKCQTDDWVIVHDPDEWFNEQFCKDVRRICEKAKREGIDLLLINAHDILIKEDGTREETVSTFFKNLIFRKRLGTHYEGVGKAKVLHETLIIPGLQKTVKLPPKYWYEHVKYWYEVWERAARNVFIAGGGNNAGERNPSWKPLRKICDELGLDTWPKAREYFRKGNIDPRLKEWLWENRSEGFDYDHEEMEFGRWYFEYLHPEEAKFPDGRVWKPVFEVDLNSPAGIMKYVEKCYLEILGRHADQEGKEAYTKAILEGKIRKEDLPNILRRSREYMEREGIAPERVRMQIPVNVDIGVTPEMFVEALRRSTTFWIDIKPLMDVGKFIKKQLGEEWRDFERWFYRNKDKLTLADFIKRLEEVVETIKEEIPK